MNERFQNALKRTPQATPPIWFMRQAGRYHAHYQALRAKHNFMEMCKDPVLAAQVALGPIQDFDFDVSILFSDLLFPLEAMGMGLKYDPSPELGWNLTPEKLKDLKRVDEAIEGLKFQKQAVIETRKVLPKSKSLIGFVGGPWTLFAYAVEGAHKGGLEESKRLLKTFKPFCEILIPILIENIKLQLDGGAEIVMLFDTAAGELSPRVYREGIVPALARLARAYPKRLGYYAKGVTPWHMNDPLFADPALFAGLGVDHRWPVEESLARFKTGFVQGGFDQSLLFQSPDEFESELRKYLEPLVKLGPEGRAGWVSGLGHGVLPKTPEANVRRMVQVIREVMK